MLLCYHFSIPSINSGLFQHFKDKEIDFIVHKSPSLRSIQVYSNTSLCWIPISWMRLSPSLRSIQVYSNDFCNRVGAPNLHCLHPFDQFRSIPTFTWNKTKKEKSHESPSLRSIQVYSNCPWHSHRPSYVGFLVSIPSINSGLFQPHNQDTDAGILVYSLHPFDQFRSIPTRNNATNKLIATNRLHPFDQFRSIPTVIMVALGLFLLSGLHPFDQFRSIPTMVGRADAPDAEPVTSPSLRSIQVYSNEKLWRMYHEHVELSPSLRSIQVYSNKFLLVKPTSKN